MSLSLDPGEPRGVRISADTDGHGGHGALFGHGGHRGQIGRVPLIAAAMALGAGVVWSLGAIAARWADRTDAFQYLVWRSIGIIIVVELLASRRRLGSPTVRAYTSGRPMMVANVMLLIASLGYVYAVKATSPANAAFLASTGPVFGALMARVVLREHLGRRTIITIAVAFTGLLVTVVGDLGAGSMIGNLAALSSAIGFAGYTIAVRRDPTEDWSAVMPGYGVMMIVICATVVVAHDDTLLPPATDIALAMVHGGVIIVVGTTLYNLASRRVPAAAMTVFAQSEQVLVPIWAITVLGDAPRPTAFVGGALILGAIVGKAVLDARSTPETRTDQSRPCGTTVT